MSGDLYAGPFLVPPSLRPGAPEPPDMPPSDAEIAALLRLGLDPRQIAWRLLCPLHQVIHACERIRGQRG